MKIEILLTCITIALAGACETPEAEPPAAPEPIGPELLSFTATTDDLGCGEAHLYRAQRLIQFQCFSTRRNAFSYENRGTLSVEGEAALDAALASADLDNTEPAPDDGLCKSAEAKSSSTTLWVDDQSFTYYSACPTMGILELHEVAETLIADISDCNEPGTVLDLLESIEPGCRQY